MDAAKPAGIPLFSVVVPTYGRSALLHEALASVLAQRVRDLECLVVDDAGPGPRTGLPDDPRVRVVRREVNGGAAAARNTGLALARGRYVAFCDDDDLWTPARLDLALAGLRRADVGVCHRSGLDGTSRSRESLHGQVHPLIAGSLTPSPGQTAVRREVCPRFDERFRGCEDVDWWIRLTRTCRVSTVPEVGYLVRDHAGDRHLSGAPARVAGSRLLLQVHAAYFAAHPRARAFRLRRLGLLALQSGDRGLARRALLRSLTAAPGPRSVWHLARAAAPSRGRRRPAVPA